MNNYEYYKDDLEGIVDGNSTFCDFMKRHVLIGNKKCRQITCSECRVLAIKWGQEEHTTDWETIPVNTPVLVKDYSNAEWKKRKFAMYLPKANYNFYVFGDGADKKNAREIIPFAYCKLLPVDEKEV